MIIQMTKVCKKSTTIWYLHNNELENDISEHYMQNLNEKNMSLALWSNSKEHPPSNFLGASIPSIADSG